MRCEYIQGDREIRKPGITQVLDNTKKHQFKQKYICVTSRCIQAMVDSRESIMINTFIRMEVDGHQVV